MTNEDPLLTQVVAPGPRTAEPGGLRGAGGPAACVPAVAPGVAGRKRRVAGLPLGVLVGVWVLGAGSAVASAASETFVYTGGEQTFTVPAGVTSVHVLAVGGGGGSGYALGPVGGSGAAVTADLSVTAGQVLYVEVAGIGRDGGVDAPGEGGFNGGAAGGLGGGGGGGASDVRAVSRSASDSLGSRLIVAGGGGGSAGNQMICNGVVRISGGAGGGAGEPGRYGGANSCGGMASAVGWSASGGDAGSASAGGLGGFSAGDGLCFCEVELDPGEDGSVGAGGAGAGGQGGGGGGGGGYFGGGGGGAGLINTATMAGGGGGGGGGSSFLAESTSAGSVALDSTGVPSSVQISYGQTTDPSPVVSLATPADGSSTNDPTATFSGSAGTAPDDADTVTLKLYAGTSSSATPVQTRTATRQSDGSWAVAAAPALADGAYTARAEQSDAAGNTGSSSAHTFRVDTVAPPAPSSSAGPYSNTGAVSLSGSAEADSTIDLYEGASRVAGARANAAGAWSRTLTGVAEGAHTYTATATDEAGNTSGASDPVTVTVDTTPPDSMITSGPSGPTNDPDPSFSFNGSDALTPAADLVYALKLDDGNWAAFSSATSATPAGSGGLADGPHTFSVRARDQAGNEDPTPAQRTLVVDTAAPSGTVLINGVASRTRTQSVTLLLNASDPSPATGVTHMRIANSQTALASARWTAWATQQSWTLTPGKGTKTVYVQYKDAASNVSPVANDSITYKP